MDRAEYLAFRSPYEPSTPKLIIVAESPPFSGKYFYNPSGSATEPLFAAIMRQMGVKPAVKEIGLRLLKERGVLLVDATYEPVNGYTDAKKTAVIERDYPQLLKDLRLLNPNRSAPLVLIKVNVCRILENRLNSDGFSVANCGRAIPFPSTGQQGKFHLLFADLIRRAGLGEALQPKQSSTIGVGKVPD